jgi:predicted SAM-dependent methyltransferase
MFTEHMIEHISFSSAFFMLKECNRVMKKDGAIRISTPNLRFLIALYSDNLSDVEKEYLNHSRKYLDQNMPLNPATVINNFFRDWGHQFIYDFENLQFLLSRSGFRDIKEVEVGFSDCKELRGLEMHGNEIGVEFNRLESIVVEAKK